MPTIIKEKVNRNSKRIWGTFRLSDGSTTRFEMRKGESWFQWKNSTENLGETVERVEELCSEWLEV